MAQYFRIATKDFCNTLKPGSFTGDTMMCPTRSQIESAGLHIKKGYTYAADQLVPEDHIERLDWEYTFSVTPATATISAAGGSRKFTVTSYKRQYSYSNAGNRIYVEGSQTNVAYTSENSGSGTWTAANDTVSYSSNPGGAEKNGIITWTQSESFGSDPKKTATATHKQNADSIKPDGDGYGNPRITAFSYPTVIPAAGGSSIPSYSYEQTVYWVSGKTTTLTSGGTPTFNRTSGTATVNSSSGLADTGSKGITQSGQTTVAVVSLTITMNGKSSPASSANVYQAENKIESTSWNPWNVSVSADRTNFPREGGTTTVRASATRTGTHTWSSGSTSSANDSGTPSLSLSDTSGFSLSSNTGTSATLTVSVNNGAERSTRITASYGGASDQVRIDQEVGILTDRQWNYRYDNICSINISNTSWSWNDTSKRSFSVDSRRGTGSCYRDGTSTDGGTTWNWGDWSDWSSFSYTNIPATSSVTGSFSISGSTVGPTSSNTGESSRSGTLSASNAYTSDSVTLTQGANVDYDYRISISPASYNFGASGGSTSFTVTPQTREGSGSPISWGDWYDSPEGSYSLSTSLPLGITASKSGNTVSVSATANSSTSSGRKGSFTVTHSGDGSKSAGATVTQDKKDDITTKTEYQYEFSVSPASLSFSADGGTQSVTVASRRRPVTLTYTNGSLTDESAGSWSTWSSYSGRISSGAGFSVSGTSVTAGANSSTSSREGNLELTQTQTSDYSGSTSSYKSDSSSLNVPLDQMGADIKSVNFIHLSYSWQSKDGAYDIYSVYASASYKVASTVIVECRLTYGSSLGAGAENYAFTISSGSTTSSARKCYTFTGDYPGVMPGTGSVRPSEDETYRYSFLE